MELINDKTPLFVENNRGVKIKVCCASCKHERIPDDLVRAEVTKDSRLCTLTGCYCENNKGACEGWELKEKYTNWGELGKGRIKSLRFLMWHLEEYLAWKKKEEEAPKSEKLYVQKAYQASLKNERNLYESTKGRVYID